MKQIEIEILKPSKSVGEMAVICGQYIAFNIQEIQKIAKISDRFALSLPLIGAMANMNILGFLSDAEFKRLHALVDQLNRKGLKS